MKRFKILAILLLLPVIACAETSWYVYISTDLPHYIDAKPITSTDTVKIVFPTDDNTFSCTLRKPYYFQIPGIPYPLGVHRYLECYLGKDYALAADVACGLLYNDVHDTELLLQTPNLVYGISFQCANFVEENKQQ